MDGAVRVPVNYFAGEDEYEAEIPTGIDILQSWSPDKQQLMPAKFYAYLIRTEIGNKMVAAKVNGNLVSPTHVLENAEVVEIPAYKEVLPGLDSWRASKIDSWHHLEGHSIDWLCVVSMDRKGLIAEVTTVLAAEGIAVCSCVAEIDRGRGLAVMLFQIEANIECLVRVCAKVDLILGVLGWSSGCSWPKSTDDDAQVLECYSQRTHVLGHEILSCSVEKKQT